MKYFNFYFLKFVLILIVIISPGETTATQDIFDHDTLLRSNPSIIDFIHPCEIITIEIINDVFAIKDKQMTVLSGKHLFHVKVDYVSDNVVNKEKAISLGKLIIVSF